MAEGVDTTQDMGAIRDIEFLDKEQREIVEILNDPKNVFQRVRSDL